MRVLISHSHPWIFNTNDWKLRGGYFPLPFSQAKEGGIVEDGNRLKGFCSVEEKPWKGAAGKGYFSEREITIKLSSPTPIFEFIMPGQIWVWEISKVSASCCHHFYEKWPNAREAEEAGLLKWGTKKNNVRHFLVGYILWPFLITENCWFQHNHRPSGRGLFKTHNIMENGFFSAFSFALTINNSIFHLN